MGFLNGKRILVVGVASHRSIAYGVARALAREGGQLAIAYQNDRLRERVGRLAVGLGCEIYLPCDLTCDTEINRLFEQLTGPWPEGLDGIVHSVAYAPSDQLQDGYTEGVTREGFRIAHEVSAYSFSALAKAGLEQLRTGAGLVTMSYLGAVRAVPHYNVMGLAKASLEASVRFLAADLGPRGIRVNAISAGPIKTAAAKGIGDFGRMLAYGERNAPLRRNVTIDEVGNAAAFLCSDLASGITGDILYVDAGYQVQGMAVAE